MGSYPLAGSLACNCGGILWTHWREPTTRPGGWWEVSKSSLGPRATGEEGKREGNSLLTLVETENGQQRSMRAMSVANRIGNLSSLDEAGVTQSLNRLPLTSIFSWSMS